MKKTYKFQSKIKIPLNVKVNKIGDTLNITGPLGKSRINIKKLDYKGNLAIKIDQQNNELDIIGSKKAPYNSLINIIQNKLTGVNQGYITYLRLFGIGYRCTLDNDILTFKVGYSHDVRYKIPKSVRIFLIEPTLLSIFGIDKNQVTQIAAQIRNIKPPSPYKGKGIRLAQEIVRLKQGKQK